MREVPVERIAIVERSPKANVVDDGLHVAAAGTDADTAALFASRLDAHYPTGDVDTDRELCRMLVYFQAPTVAEKTLALLEAAETQEDGIYYAFTLRLLENVAGIREPGKLASWLLKDRKILVTSIKHAQFEGIRVSPSV